MRIIFAIVVCLLISTSVSAQNIDNRKFSNKILNNPRVNKEVIDSLFEYTEISTFVKNEKKGEVILENGYAKSKIIDKDKWEVNVLSRTISSIDIVFTKYPKKKKDWITNYYDLLTDRLNELFLLDPSLNDKNIEWKLVLQTSCNNEPETEKLFHGIVIRYEDINLQEKNEFENEIEVDNKDVKISATTKKDITAEERYIYKAEHFVNFYGGIKDSTVYKAFQRHPEWKNCLVIMDWTASMYTYAGQAVIWHTYTFKESQIKYFVFFNDGDQKPTQLKNLGEAGGVYSSEAQKLDDVLDLMEIVMHKGTGGDWPENDIEAILTGIEKFPEFDNVILIADNHSTMRDYQLLNRIKVPVHVILCGVRRMCNVEYVNLAYRTGGSIHTIDQDIENISSMFEKKDAIMLYNNKYVLNASDLIELKIDVNRSYDSYQRDKK